MQTVKSHKASTAKSFWIPIQLEHSSLGNDGSKPQTSKGMFGNPKQKSPGLCSSTAQACSSPSIYRPGAHITTIADCALQLFCISRRAGKNRLHFDLALFWSKNNNKKKAIRKESGFGNHKGPCSQSHSSHLAWRAPSTWPIVYWDYKSRLQSIFILEACKLFHLAWKHMSKLIMGSLLPRASVKWYTHEVKSQPECNCIIN